MNPVEYVNKLHLINTQSLRTEDRVVVEEALLINLRHRNQRIPLAMTMRTPGQDHALIAGYLLTEGLIKSSNDIREFKTIRSCGDQVGSTILVSLDDKVRLPEKAMLRFGTISSACGICGKTSLNDMPKPSGNENSITLTKELLLAALHKSRGYQSLFEETGGSHQACLLNLEGNVLGSCEDVGRHNALDKLIGQFLLADRLQELGQSILFLSGRCGFELIQKAAMAHIPVVVSVGAPSSLAIKKAHEFGITLAGFLKQNSVNIYTGWERVDNETNQGH